MPKFGIIAGDPLMAGTKRLIPTATGYAVDYPASFEPISKTKGVDDTVKHLAEASVKCPNQKYVLVGYSQGADVMHNAIVKLPESLHSRIIALIMFGDPGNKNKPGALALSPLGGTVPDIPSALRDKVKQNCAPGDPVSHNIRA
jgi:hypothetical protein